MAQTKRCPDCAELVQADARVCRYCGYAFTFGAAKARARRERGRRHPASCCGCSCGGVLAVLVVAVTTAVGLMSLGLVWAGAAALGVSFALVSAVDVLFGGRPRRSRPRGTSGAGSG